MSELSEQVNFVYQRFIAMYDRSCQICCKWSRWLGFKVPAHRSNMPQINMIPHPVTLKLTLSQPALL